MFSLELPSTIQSYLNALENKKVVIGFSGGPDSVATYKLISDYYASQGRNTNNIILAHYNHHMRSESSQEADYIQSHYPRVELSNYTGISSKEADLRKARHDFFQECMKKHHTKTLILGHNLTDRLETTLMNVERGAGINGIGNMQMIDHKNRLLINNYSILRPLLGYAKELILRRCKQHEWHYFEDPSNNNPSVSYRNYLRLYIITPLYSGNTQALKDRRNQNKHNISYGDLGDVEKLFQHFLTQDDTRDGIRRRYAVYYDSNTGTCNPKPIPLPAYFGFDSLFELERNINIHDIVAILKGIGQYHNSTRAYLEELLCFCQQGNQGHKVIGKRQLEICHNRVFLYLTNDCFNAGQVVTFWLQLSHYEIIRLVNTTTDTYKSKPINKRFINNKVPRFLRHVVGVDAQGRFHEELVLECINKT